MDLFWSMPALYVGAAVTVAVLDERVPQTVAYGIGWGVPPLWALVWVGITILWVQMALRREEEVWIKEGDV